MPRTGVVKFQIWVRSQDGGQKTNGGIVGLPVWHGDGIEELKFGMLQKFSQ
jgi:hypothetical protein